MTLKGDKINYVLLLCKGLWPPEATVTTIPLINTMKGCSYIRLSCLPVYRVAKIWNNNYKQRWGQNFHREIQQEIWLPKIACRLYWPCPRSILFHSIAKNHFTVSCRSKLPFVSFDNVSQLLQSIATQSPACVRVFGCSWIVAAVYGSMSPLSSPLPPPTCSDCWLAV